MIAAIYAIIRAPAAPQQRIVQVEAAPETLHRGGVSERHFRARAVLQYPRVEAATLGYSRHAPDIALPVCRVGAEKHVELDRKPYEPG